MKPTELRIGDYVKYQGHIYIVEELSAKGWVHLIHPETKARVNMTSDYIIDLLEPIPLTPEILEKQGEQKSIWHNEDEEPKRGSLILLIMQSGTPVVAKVIEPHHTFNHGERWAYIDELIKL